MECAEHQQVSSEDTFAQIPTKRSTSALASALAVAPSEPFTPITSSLLEPVPLPEETIPYFPPEHPRTDIIQNVDSSYTPSTKKKHGTDELFKDLPKPPPEKISMLAALTTAPEKPYSPFPTEKTSYTAETVEAGLFEASKQCSASEVLQTKQETKKTASARSQEKSSQSKTFLKNVDQVSINSQKSLCSPFTGHATSYQAEKIEKDKSKLIKASASEVF